MAAAEASCADGRLAERPDLTLGTAGHIDHGKTALVTLLTGKNTDRLREERERGISIELGYAELDLPSGRRLSVVDVPGHERFVRTMVAGATGIDLFLLVVAADDGVMPQTVEHLAVIELLGVTEGVVALTKADLVDDELLELARADAEALPRRDAVSRRSSRDRERARRSRHPRAARGPRVGRGAACSARAARAPARLPIDRVFPLKGIGTVVTGTLWRGALARRRRGPRRAGRSAGDRAQRPGARPRARTSPAAAAVSGVNLRGVEREAIARGQWLVGPRARRRG